MSPNRSCKKNTLAAGVVAGRKASRVSCLVARFFGAAVLAAGLFGASPAFAQETSVYLRALHSGKCLHVNGASSANGAAITQWDCANQPHITWRLRYLGGGSMYLVADHSGKCAQVNGGGTANSVQVTQWDCQPVPHVIWRLDAAPRGLFIVNRKSGKCLHVEGASTRNGGDISQYACIDQLNVQWTIVPVQ